MQEEIKSWLEALISVSQVEFNIKMNIGEIGYQARTGTGYECTWGCEGNEHFGFILKS
jgi:hypothetical protein